MVDEHYSKVGLITRIEAFLLNLNKNQNKEYQLPLPKNIIYEKPCDLKKELPLFIPHYEKLSDFTAQALNAAGYMAFVLPPTDQESLSLGKDNTTSKEYISFVSLLGDVLRFARDNPKDGSLKQLLLFQTEGSEADGFYAMVIRSKLNQLGRDDIIIVAPKLEDLIFAEDKLFSEIWKILCKLDKSFEASVSEKENTILLIGDPLVY